MLESAVRSPRFPLVLLGECIEKSRLTITLKALQDHLDKMGTNVSRQTIRRTLHKYGPSGPRPKKAPLLAKKHREARLADAKRHEVKDLSFWSSVHKTKMELLGDSKVLLRPKNTAPTVKFEGGSVNCVGP